MTRTIDFYFDFPSPYSYLAHTQLPRIAAEHGAAVAYHPFRILELMKIVGNRPTTIECKNKGKYAGADLQRWTRRYNVDFARNPHSKSFDFAELDRGALVAIEMGERGRHDRPTGSRNESGRRARGLRRTNNVRWRSDVLRKRPL
jgi:2-hydroxychromene-2-carboxylate isomerase